MSVECVVSLRKEVRDNKGTRESPDWLILQRRQLRSRKMKGRSTNDVVKKLLQLSIENRWLGGGGDGTRETHIFYSIDGGPEHDLLGNEQS